MNIDKLIKIKFNFFLFPNYYIYALYSYCRNDGPKWCFRC